MNYFCLVKFHQQWSHQNLSYIYQCKLEKKQAAWEKIASRWKINTLSSITNEITLNEVKDAYSLLLAGKAVGRYVVRIKD